MSGHGFWQLLEKTYDSIERLELHTHRLETFVTLAAFYGAQNIYQLKHRKITKCKYLCNSERMQIIREPHRSTVVLLHLASYGFFHKSSKAVFLHC